LERQKNARMGIDWPRNENFRPGAASNQQRFTSGKNMIVGTGIDLTDISRIQRSIDRYGSRFLNRVYTPAEQAYCLRKRNSAESFAARFAAKEAGAKALGTGISHGVHWLEIEVVRPPGARPSVLFHNRAAQFAARLGVVRTALSITHTGSVAMASVILEDGA
jgi:holo-[acyl-carrier protein] synthase